MLAPDGPLPSWIAAAHRRPAVWLAALSLLFVIQISPWLYPSVDGCLYLKTVTDFLAAPRLADFCCLVPPGYPLLIAPAFVFGDRPFLAVSILQCLLAVATIGGVYVWARRLFPSAALVLTTAVAVNISVWTFYRRPTKEIATLAILMWTVNAMHRLLEERRRTQIVAWTIAVTALTTYLVLIRYAAITLTAGFALVAWWQARRGAFPLSRAIVMSGVIAICSGMALTSWLVFDRSHGTHGEYLKSLVRIYRGSAKVRVAEGDGNESDTLPTDPESLSHDPRRPRSFLRGLLFRMNDITCLAVPGLWKSNFQTGAAAPACAAVALIVFAVFAVGWWKLAGAKSDLLLLVFPIYFLLYAHWDCDQPGGRFLLPMLPVVLAGAGVGLATVLGRFGSTSLRRQAAVVGLLIAAHGVQATGYWLLIDAPRARECQQNLPLVDRLAARIRQPDGDVAIAPSASQILNGFWLDLDWKRLKLLDSAVAQKAEWIVDSADSPPIDGFSVDCVDGPFRLLHRDSAIANSHTEPSRVARTNEPANRE